MRHAQAIPDEVRKLLPEASKIWVILAFLQSETKDPALSERVRELQDSILLLARRLVLAQALAEIKIRKEIQAFLRERGL